MQQLTIITPCTAAHKPLLDRLVIALSSQPGYDAYVEHVIDMGGESTGLKRQRCLDNTCTPYVVHLDADDFVAVDYIPLILDSLVKQPDCVGFWQQRNKLDGKVESLAKYSNTCTVWGAHTHWDNTITRYRYPCHITPIRTDIAKQVKFGDKTIGEDVDYAMSLKAAGLVQSEVFIDRVLYYYNLHE